MNDDDLALLAVAVPREIETRKCKRKADFYAYVREQLGVLGLSKSQMQVEFFRNPPDGKRASEQDKRSSVRAKYRDPKTGSTWSGRGGAPKWFADHVAAGGSKDELRIPDPEAEA